ncbi:MAG: FAD-binding oxidoreductase [Bacteroidales bacterium]
MTTCRIATRPPVGPVVLPVVSHDPDAVASFLEDAAHYHGGHAAGVAFARTEGEVAAVLRACDRVLPIGAQSSLTGGATPMGEVILNTTRLADIIHIGDDCVRLHPGVVLSTLQESLARAGRYYPPAPTYNGACVGGTLSTNASGAATFKYGSTREWVRALTVVLASGEVLEIERGQVRAAGDGFFEVQPLAGEVQRVPVPSYRMPNVPKRSAGYFAEPGMDLVDLFVGSEGTLGVIVEARLNIVAHAPTRCLALVPCPTEKGAIALVDWLRRESHATWRERDPRGLDVSAIEQMDRRCLEMLREDGEDRKHDVQFPDGTAVALLVQIELPSDITADAAFDQLAAARDADAADTPLLRFCRLLDRAGVLDDVEMALPGDTRRAEQFFAVREAVPSAVKHRVGVAKQEVDPSIEKTAADMVVPFEQFADVMAVYHDGFGRRGLDYAIWGHISDGNVHPNVIPRTVRDMTLGREAVLEFGREVIARGGCPLAEHGVGRSPLKQALLRQLYGDEGVEQMRAVKRALDPQWKLSPGVLFPLK